MGSVGIGTTNRHSPSLLALFIPEGHGLGAWSLEALVLKNHAVDAVQEGLDPLLPPGCKIPYTNSGIADHGQIIPGIGNRFGDKGHSLFKGMGQNSKPTLLIDSVDSFLGGGPVPGTDHLFDVKCQIMVIAPPDFRPHKDQ